MANWNESIRVEVKLPYITHGCTLGRLTAEITITASDIWFSGHDRESRVWKAYVHWGDYPVLIMGKAVNTPKHGDRQTTCKVGAWCSCDGMIAGKEKYATRVLAYK